MFRTFKSSITHWYVVRCVNFLDFRGSCGSDWCTYDDLLQIMKLFHFGILTKNTSKEIRTITRRMWFTYIIISTIASHATSVVSSGKSRHEKNRQSKKRWSDNINDTFHRMNMFSLSGKKTDNSLDHINTNITP